MAGLRPSRKGPWSLADTYDFIAIYLSKFQGRRNSQHLLSRCPSQGRRLHTSQSNSSRHSSRPHKQPLVYTSPTRHFHDYFVTHLPSSSLHPDSRSSSGPHHKLPRSASTPHALGSSPAAALPLPGPGSASRELTVVRIPLRSAKHHFGVSVSRGSRPYNEDNWQAGTIEIPAFAKRGPISLTRSPNAVKKDGLEGDKGGNVGGGTSADSASGDPQVFYFGVFDGHGGNECSEFLREELHGYVENVAGKFELGSSLKKGKQTHKEEGESREGLSSKGRSGLNQIKLKNKGEVEAEMRVPTKSKDGAIVQPDEAPAIESEEPVKAESNTSKVLELEKSLVQQWKDTVGGYFRRFRPDYFSSPTSEDSTSKPAPTTIESVLMYAFLKADLDFITAQSRKPDADSDAHADRALNADDVLGEPSLLTPNKHRIGGPTRFIGGSTASIALISTPTPTPFWHPASPSTLLVAHVGDTRILLCETSTGLPVPLTTNHHPSTPVEADRLRRYAATFVTDSFGEERMSGLANTRAFGDMRSKRIGVSAEPEIRRVELAPAQYSMLVIVSDGVSGTLSDQEIVDIVKEAKTPDQGTKDLVQFATEVSRDGDNATCLVVRLGGWERRGEGGVGSLGTKEARDWKKEAAMDPRTAAGGEGMR